MQNEAKAREAVRTHYADVAREGCGCGPGCCGSALTSSSRLGYSNDEMAAAPAGADLGLGCGNPQAIAALRRGETVLDLGSGGGFDCFLAARQVGMEGRVIGVDMTAEMIERARANAEKVSARNVSFRLGEIEHLPVEDRTVDVILSNCVINLSLDKARVFREAFRVLKPGGRLAIFDVVATGELPEDARGDLAAFSGCMAGAARHDEVETMLTAAGFVDVRVSLREESRALMRDWMPGSDAADLLASASIEARKPDSACCDAGCCGGEAKQ